MRVRWDQDFNLVNVLKRSNREKISDREERVRANEANARLAEVRFITYAENQE